MGNRNKKNAFKGLVFTGCPIHFGRKITRQIKNGIDSIQKSVSYNKRFSDKLKKEVVVIVFLLLLFFCLFVCCCCCFFFKKNKYLNR